MWLFRARLGGLDKKGNLNVVVWGPRCVTMRSVPELSLVFGGPCGAPVRPVSCEVTQGPPADGVYKSSGGAD